MIGDRRTRPLHWAGAVVVTALAGGLSIASCNKPTPVEPPMIPEFERRITAYLDVQRNAIAELPALKRTDDPIEITAREQAMGQAIRNARSNAKQGDIITPEIGNYFRRLVKEDAAARTPEELKLMRDEIPAFEPTVNQTYPPQYPLATFPATLLKVMPALPEGLEYRLVSRSLILRDIKANIIIDFLADVFHTEGHLTWRSQMPRPEGAAQASCVKSSAFGA
jgi:hypothetical protein